ncbi:Hok/Gef family protein [Pantoea sp. YU22]|nr:Hok/Gef family protein [Pantoea sp. YU22]
MIAVALEVSALSDRHADCQAARKSLCEIRYRDNQREVAASMAYESGK